MRKLVPLFTVAAILACSTAAHAALLGYEGFAGYTAGSPMTGQAGTGNSGFAPASTWGGGGAFHRVQATSLSYTNGGTLVTSGGSALSTSFANDTRPLTAPLATTTTTGQELWVAYLFQSGQNREDANLVRFYNTASGIDGQRIDLNVVRGWPDTTQQLVDVGAWVNGSGAAAGSALFGAPGAVDLVVLQYKMDDANTTGNQGVMYAWVNPVIGGAPPSIGSASVTYSGLGGFDSPDALRLFSPGGGGAAVVRDEIRWGTTFADVTPTIPEPATIGLLAVAAAGLFAIRRRS